MQVGLRRLTAREHFLAALVLVYALTMIAGDIAMPDAARLRYTGHSITASILATLPLFALVTSLIVLLPRTANQSRRLLFRIVGRVPLLVRCFALALLLYGFKATIKLFAG